MSKYHQNHLMLHFLPAFYIRLFCQQAYHQAYIWLLSILFYFSIPFMLYAQEPACQMEPQALSPSEYLRALSLDLRGELPTQAELEALDQLGQVSDDMIDSMINSDAFAQRFVRFQRALVWPYLGNSNTTPGYRLSYDAPWENGTRTRLWFFPRPELRGDALPCRNERESRPDDPIMIEEAGGKRREGYICVRRYAAHPFGDSDPDCPEGEIKVCAQDALTHLQSLVTGDRCDMRINQFSGPPIGCGCGPQLRWCGDYQQFLQPLLDGLDRQIRWVIDQNRPYYEMLAEAPPILNGPLAHYYKYMAPFINASMPISPSIVPDMDYRNPTLWIEIDAGDEARGILTNWVFLARFITQRARVDRFYQSFLCQPFQPPVLGIDTNTADRDQPDLQQRNGCKYCHSIIEPIAAYWGRYAEGGVAYLDPGQYPDFDPECLNCAIGGPCSQRCTTQYITQAPTGAELPYLGYLKAFLFRKPEHQAYLNEGPKALVRRALLDGRLGACTVKNTFKWLIGRDFLSDEAQWIEALTQGFMENNYQFKSLVKALVKSEIYRRVK